MSSSADSAARPLPRLARVWDGAGRAAQHASGSRRSMDLVFLAVPENAAAELAPPLVDAGVRVIDLSGAFRIRDDARAIAVVSGDEVAAGGRGVRPDRALSRPTCATRALVANPGCYPTAALLALLPLAKAGLLDAGRRRRRSTRSRASRARAARRAIARTSRRTTARSPRTACSAIGTSRRWNRSSARSVTFVPHLVPLDRGILETIYVKVAPGTTAEQIARCVQRGVRERAVRPADRRRAAGDQARRVDELLRHRLAARRRHRGRLVIVACLDNLVKGAAGQALQNFNVACGFDERTALL